MNIVLQKCRIMRQRLDAKRSLRVYGYMIMGLIFFMLVLLSVRGNTLAPDQAMSDRTVELCPIEEDISC